MIRKLARRSSARKQCLDSQNGLVSTRERDETIKSRNGRNVSPALMMRNPCPLKMSIRAPRRARRNVEIRYNSRNFILISLPEENG